MVLGGSGRTGVHLIDRALARGLLFYHISENELADSDKVTESQHWSGSLLLSLRRKDFMCSKVCRIRNANSQLR